MSTSLHDQLTGPRESGLSDVPAPSRGGLRRLSVVIFVTVLIAALVPGILNRIELDYFPTSAFAIWYGTAKTDWLHWLADLDPKQQKYGVAYWLGWAGFTLMLPLFIYPLRKRLRFFRRREHSARWLQVHVVLGALAPVVILYHFNFRFGLLTSNIAVNSWLALWSMVAIITSGLVGRYVFLPWSKHEDRARNIDFAFNDLSDAYGQLAASDPGLAELVHELGAFNAREASPRQGRLATIGHAVFSSGRHSAFRRRLLKRGLASIDRLLRNNPGAQQHAAHWASEIRDRNDRYFDAARGVVWSAVLRRSSSLRLVFRLSRYWNYLHVPASIILFLALLAHIYVTI